MVTATGVGTALIFAYVTIDGTTGSNSYPLKVMPDLSPGSISVGGKSIKGFDKNIKAYSYLMKKDAKVPAVKASALSKGVSVEIEKAKGIPGTTVITYIDNITLETNTYFLNFDTKSITDEFKTDVTGEQWEWIREHPSNHSLSKKPGWFTITSEPGDVSESTNNAKNMLLQSANNDWTIETKLSASRVPAQPENAGIMVYQDDMNFVKLMFRAVIKTVRFGRQGGQQQRPGTIDLIMEENDITKSVASFNLPAPITGEDELLLRLEKRGSLYTGYYALDGENFEMLGTADMLLKDIRVGLIVCDGVITQNMKSTFWFDPDTTKPATPLDVSFDYFRIENSGLK
jgi:beta-glucosidase